MTSVMSIAGSIDVNAWREQARALVLAGAEPAAVEWIDVDDPQGSLHGPGAADVGPLFPSPAHAAGRRGPPAQPSPPPLLVPRSFLALARLVLAHRDPGKWALLYRLLWRLTRGREGHGERHVLSNPLDDDTHAANLMAKSVKRDAHKMKAFVRFRRVTSPSALGGIAEHYLAFHKPEHPIIRLVAPFFARRFSVMAWTILTPSGSATWDTRSLTFGPPATRDQAGSPDALEDFWKTYYASVFNPARANPRAMTKEMPRKYWSTLPEAALIDDLLKNAPERTRAMAGRLAPGGAGAAAYVPAVARGAEGDPRVVLPQLAAAARSCRGCDLCERATQTVFGVGPPGARVMLVGEQPGDQEDLAGVPFVGPAGQVLNRALADVRGAGGAGLDRDALYLTNAVKHFKWSPDPRGKRRLHARPSPAEVRACKPWLEAELHAVKPDVLVLLGSTAAQSLLGAGFRVTMSAGKVLLDTSLAPAVVATVHPSAVLRAPTPAQQQALRDQLTADLRTAAARARAL